MLREYLDPRAMTYRHTDSGPKGAWKGLGNYGAVSLLQTGNVVPKSYEEEETNGNCWDRIDNPLNTKFVY
jgi:hypothetical protein